MEDNLTAIVARFYTSKNHCSVALEIALRVFIGAIEVPGRPHRDLG